MTQDGDGSHKSEGPAVFEGIGWVLLLGFAGFWQLQHFSGLALTWDASEYVYCIRHLCLPHSPYFLHFLAGWGMGWWVSPDWGLSLLSFLSSLASMVLLGQAIKGATGSRLAGALCGMVFVLAPVQLTYSGIQEVYPFQFFWIVLAWVLLLFDYPIRWAALAFGAAVLTHTGTVLAMPATLLLLWTRGPSTLDPGPHGTSFHTDGVSRNLRGSSVGVFVGIAFLPLAVTAGALGLTWMVRFGFKQGVSMMAFYLKGLTPSPDLGALLEGGVEPLLDRAAAIGANLVSAEVFGWPLVVGGLTGLVLLPNRWRGFWLLLMIPYLGYELLTIGTVDEGVYGVFVLPALTAGLVGWMPEPGGGAGLRAGRIVRFGVLVVFLVLVGWNFKRFQDQGRDFVGVPENRSRGAAMQLCDWVRKNSPPESVVVNPLAWSFAPFAGALYTERLPILAAIGCYPVPKKGLPFYRDPLFETLIPLSQSSMDRWMEEDRPVLSFDRNPLTGFGFHWNDVDLSQYEVEPLFWMDRNLSGSSLAWEKVEVIARVDLGQATDEEQYRVELPEGAVPSEIELPYYRPTLYRIVKTDSDQPLPKGLAQVLEAIPADRRGAPPVLKQDGYAMGQAGGAFSLTLPVEPGSRLVAHLVMLNRKKPIKIECQVGLDSKWVVASRDEVNLMDDPEFQFVDLYFPLSPAWVLEANLRLRFVSKGEEGTFNAFLVEVGKAPERQGREPISTGSGLIANLLKGE